MSNLIFSIKHQVTLDRLHLKSSYNLDQELSSPCDISGGNTGSIAYYAETNKKNTQLNPEKILLNHQGDMVYFKNNWHHKAQIEYRLASSCIHFNLYNQCNFLLLNCLSSYLSFKKTAQKPIKKTCPISKLFYSNHKPSILLQFKNDAFLIKWSQEHSKNIQAVNKQAFLSTLHQLHENILKQYCV